MASHRFIGDREAPTPLAAVHKRRAVLGTGKVPEDLQILSQVRIVYSEAEGKKPPAVRVTPVEEGGKPFWKIEVPVGQELRGALPGRVKERRPAEKFLAEVKDVPFTSHRPDWIDALPTPRLVHAGAQRGMRRIDGRRTEPLWVYDSARFAFQDSSWPWGLVGRVFNDQGFSGSGALIGGRILLTAGHMVPWSSSSWWMKFVPAYFNGSSLFGAGVESYVSDAQGYDTSGNVTGYDWAVCRLYQPLGNQLGYFGYNSYSNSWNDQGVWSNIGYPGDIQNAEEPAFQSGFTVNDTDGDNNGGEELETENCDLNHGNSGGPIFAWWNNGTDPRIVGVVSGQETEYKFPFSTRNDNVFAGGDGFVNLCAWARTVWP